MAEVFYDIYRQMEERKLRWIVRVQGLDQARERIGALELAEPGDYLIYDFRQRTVVQQLAMEQTVVQQPVLLQPAVQQPVVQQALVQQPVVQQPVIQQPVHLSAP
jgi:hypothetical protein